MDAVNFEFPIDIRGAAPIAFCQKFTVHNYPQYRVAIAKPKDKTGIYILYEVGDKEFYWFRGSEKAEQDMKSIVKGLKAHLKKHPAISKQGIKKHPAA